MEDVPQEAKAVLTFHFVDTLQDVLKLALVEEAVAERELVGV
jgi:ATP-dependent Lon protease